MASDKLPAIQLYTGDWLRDAISGCSLAAQGLWLRMMFVAHDADRYGYLELNGSPMQPGTIARRCGCELAEYESLLSELAEANVFSRNDAGTIFSRRMVRDASIRRERAKAGRKGGKQKRSKSEAKPKQNTEDEVEDEEPIEKEKRNGPPAKPPDSMPAILDHESFHDVLRRWKAYRGSAYKPKGLKSLLSQAAKRAAEYGLPAVVDAFEVAMSNGWQGWNFDNAFKNQRDGSGPVLSERNRRSKQASKALMGRLFGGEEPETQEGVSHDDHSPF